MLYWRFLVAGLALAQLIAWVAKDQSSRTWPKTTATVVASNAAPRISGDEAEQFDVDVEYEYTLGGQGYLGKEIAIADDVFKVDQSQWNDLKKSLVVGQPVVIRYNPLDHKETVVNHITAAPIYCATTVTLIVITISLILFCKPIIWLDAQSANPARR